MKKSKITQILIALLLLIWFPMWAEVVDSETATTVARNFYWERGSINMKNLDYGTISPQIFYVEEEAGLPVYYVCNIPESKGFVIVSADDDAYPIIGYAYSGTYQLENMSPSHKMMMEAYKKQINNIRKANLKANIAIRTEWTRLQQKPDIVKNAKDVGPLLSTTWGQGQYYNTDCPEDAGGDDGHVYVGCVATAMAQIMKYHEYPQMGTGSHSYYHGTYGTISANFGSTVYNWDQMPNSATTYNSALALINFHCGVSVDMNYGPDGSGASTSMVGESLSTYFGYEPTAVYQYKSNYTDSQWEVLLINELDNNRPMEYRGSGDAGGHAFVCDGYQGTSSNHFHINWGWYGYYNGYYYLSNLNPGDYTFNEGQGAVIGIQPGEVSSDYTLLFDVIDQQGAPVADAMIEINGEVLVTSQYGVATIELPAGDYTYYAYKDGYIDADGTISLYDTMGEQVVLESQSLFIGESSISVPETIVNLYDDFQIDIQTSHLDTDWEVSSYQFTFSYDPSLISYTGYTLSETLSDGGQVSVNENAGTITIGYMNSQPISGSGVLLSLDFSANSFGSTEIVVNDFIYNTTSIESVTNNWVYVVEDGLYPVNFYVNDTYGNPVSNALVTINSQTLYTNEAGECSVNLLPGQYSYIVAKEGYLQESGSVTVINEAVYVNVYIQEIGTPADSYISLSNESANPGDIVEIDVYTSQLIEEWEVTSYQFDLSFDPNVVDYYGYTLDGTIATEGVVSINEQYGEITIGLMTDVPLTGQGEIIHLQFEALETGGTELFVDDFLYNTYLVNDIDNGYINVTPANTQLVQFTVRDQYYNPIEGATVQIAGYSEITGSNGVVNLYLGNGTYDYTVTREGFIQESGSLNVNGEDLYIDVFMQEVPSIEDVEITVADVEVNLNEQFEITVSTSELLEEWDITSYQFQLNYNDYFIEYVGYEIEGTLSEGATTSINVGNSGITFGCITTEPIVGEGAIVRFIFNAVNDGTCGLGIYNFLYNTTQIYNLNYGTVEVSNDVYNVVFEVLGSEGPLSGAIVLLDGYGQEVTSYDGMAMFTDVAPGDDISYVVMSDGYISYSNSIDVVDSHVYEQVTLEPITYSVIFNVYDGGEPIEGASVQIGDEQQYTNENGMAVFYLPNGNYDYTIDAGGYASQDGQFFIQNEGVEINIKMVGINHANSFSFSMYPNPAFDYVTVDVGQVSQISIIDAIGNTLKVVSTTGKSVIEVKQFPSGIYLIKVEQNTTTLIKRLVIE